MKNNGSIDSKSGGLATTIGIDDDGDQNRSSISGGGPNQSFVNFASGFESDYAVALHNNNFTYGGLWETINCTIDNCLPDSSMTWT